MNGVGIPTQDGAAVEQVHTTARHCRVPVARALARLCTPQGMARWNLGLRHCCAIEADLFTGESLHDGSRGWVRVEVDAARGTVDYLVGASSDDLVRRIRACVLPGSNLGHGETSCVVTLLARRTATMTDERWMRLVHAHEAEIDLIQAQLESAEQTR